MKISYNWLKDYCDHSLSASRLAAGLSHAGLCVETYEPMNGDWMLDVEVTSNRPDCLSHLGIAREVAALTGGKVSQPTVQDSNEELSHPENVISISIESPDLCPHYTARIIKDVKIGPSPEWMQKRLLTCGIRPVNNVVDITNYVLLESGQPMHAFDLDRISGRSITVRRAEKGERITTIDEDSCRLNEDVCVIADASGPLAVGGIMGGIDSEINENTSTVMLESARFNPANIRKSSRFLSKSSESSYRFERGADPENVEAASRRGAELIAELACGKIVGGLTRVRSDSFTPCEIIMRTGRLRKVLGIDVEVEKIVSIFHGLGLKLKEHDDNAIKVTVPSWRVDLSREIDLIEEVARIHGYDAIPETTRIPVAMVPVSKREICERKTKKLLAGQGFVEILTSSLISPSDLQLWQPWHEGKPISLRNPVSSDKTHLRLTLMGNLLEAKQYNNSHKVTSVNLFEKGNVYLPRGSCESEQPAEKNCLAILSDMENGFFILKGLMENICSALYIKNSEIEESIKDLSSFKKGKSLFFSMGGRFLGCLGELSHKLSEEMDFIQSPAIMELDFDLLTEHASIEPSLRPMPKYPAVRRDMSVIVEESLNWAEIEKCILGNSPPELEALDFIDIYRGKQIPDRKKSVTFSMSFRSSEKTLRNEDIDRFCEMIFSSLSSDFSAALRS